MLKSTGEIIKCIPTVEALKQDVFFPISQFLIVTSSDTTEDILYNKLYISDITKNIDFEKINSIDELEAEKIEKEEPKLEKTENKPMSEPKIENKIQEEKKSPEKTEEKTQETKTETQKPTLTQQTVAQQDKKAQTSSILRVESKRIDELLNLVSELVISKASFMEIND